MNQNIVPIELYFFGGYSGKVQPKTVKHRWPSGECDGQLIKGSKCVVLFAFVAPFFMYNNQSHF